MIDLIFKFDQFFGPIELLVLFLGIPLLALSFIGLVVLSVFKRSRKLAQTLWVGFAGFFLIGLLSLFGAGPLRRLIIHRIINGAQPLLVALEQFKDRAGRYPQGSELDQFCSISDCFCDHGGDEDEDYPEYKESDCFIWSPPTPEDNSYSLSFRLNGPPFGYLFIYTPSHKYESRLHQHDFHLEEKVDGWGWYVKH